jgi:hypothetical protein
MATFSKRTLRSLGDVLSDFSTLTLIGHLFEDSGIGLPPSEVAEEAVRGVNGQRRGLTAEYVASLDVGASDDRRKLLRVFDDVLTDILQPEGDEYGDIVRAQLLRNLENDASRWGSVVGCWRWLAAASRYRSSKTPTSRCCRNTWTASTGKSTPTPPAPSAPSRRSWGAPPSSFFARYRGHLGAERPFPTLVSEAQKPLGLMVAGLAPGKAGGTSLKMVLDCLCKVAIGIDELRSRYGRETHLRGLTERHARLAVHR